MKKNEIFTIPNILSALRIIAIPIYAYIYLTATDINNHIIAAIILSASALTDLLDGFIARKFNMVTKLGTVLDPIADKLTQGVMIICLSIVYRPILILLILFIIKEGFMAVMGVYNLKKGLMLNGALLSGKICTTALFISMIAIVLFPEMPPIVMYVLIAICLFFMILSLVSYIFVYMGKNKKIKIIPVKNKAKSNNL